MVDAERATADEYAQRLFLLSEASTLLLANLNPSDVLRDLFALVAKRIQLDFAFQYRCGNDVLNLVAAWGLTPEQEIAASQIEFGQTVCGVVAATRREAYFTAIQRSDNELVAIARFLGMESYFSQPLLSGADLQGTVSFGRISGPFSPGECETLRAIAAQLSTALERHKSDADLKAREAELRFALKAGRFGAWTLDLATSELTTSETCRANFGRDPAQPFTYADLQDAVHPRDRDRMQTAVQQSIATGADYDIEYRILTPQREVRWVSIRAAPSFGADGTPLTLAGVSMDATDRVRAAQYQDGLVRLSDLFRNAQTIAELSVCAGSVLGECLDLSRAAYGTVEVATDTLHVERDWTAPGVDTLQGVTPLRDYGSFIDSLKACSFIVIDDVRLDDRTSAPAASAALESRHARSFVNVPVLEAGVLVAVIFVNCAKVRNWSKDELSFIQEVANRTRTAIERVRTELALQATAERLQALNADLERQVVERSSERGTTWQLSPFLLSVLDLATGRFVRVNPAWQDALGWSEDEMTKASFLDFLPAEDVEASLAAWGQVSSGSAVLDFENRYRAKDGSYRTLSWVAVPESGRLYSTTRDVTDEKERARLLTERTAERDALWESSEDLLVVADYDGNLIRISPSWTRLLGYSEEALLDGKYQEIIHPEDYPLVAQALQTMRDTGKPSRFEDRVRTIDGAWKTIAWVLSPHPGGRRLSGVGHNVSDQREMEDRLRQSQKMEAVGQLTGGLAHDFNNLLMGITGSLDLMKSHMAQGRSNAIDRYIDAAQGAAKRAAALTHRLLAFSRQQTLDPKPTDVNRLIAGMEDLVRRTVGPSVHIEVVGAGGLWATLVDPNQLENALLNLCINARDAMPDGGRITIETSNTWLDDRAAKDRDVPAGQYVTLSVSDTGTGMPPDVIARAFDPFYTTKPIGQGTGLGLSMIYGFARQSGGQVRIYSEVGAGTTVRIYLPRELRGLDNAPLSAGADSDAVAGSGEVVLVIDDEAVIRMLVAETLEEAGYTVIEAVDGPSGMSVLGSGTRIDLLITDVGLPGGMNGRQIADAARVQRPGLKVLFITGYAENAAVGNGHLDHGMEVVTKPFAIQDLAHKVHQLIEG